MKYLVIDASLNGTGIRDYYQGGYINPEDLGISNTTVKWIGEWLSRYANEHYNGYTNDNLIDDLDGEGKEIAYAIKEELKDVKIGYYSDAHLTKFEIK